MDVDKKMKALENELNDITVREMAKVHHYLRNDLDANGNSILDKFPYRVELQNGQNEERVTIDWDFIDWLEENIDEDCYKREWVTRIYFKNEEDAMAFKLRWT